MAEEGFCVNALNANIRMLFSNDNEQLIRWRQPESLHRDLGTPPTIWTRDGT
ncbi:hypothetical protein AA313_de0208065 [Arthrobotrys entomopaga]|nr:hypothetical protein AA313_de0208065 [Arthrobotrys entomopaga]